MEQGLLGAWRHEYMSTWGNIQLECREFSLDICVYACAYHTYVCAYKYIHIHTCVCINGIVYVYGNHVIILYHSVVTEIATVGLHSRRKVHGSDMSHAVNTEQCDVRTAHKSAVK